MGGDAASKNSFARFQRIIDEDLSIACAVLPFLSGIHLRLLPFGPEVPVEVPQLSGSADSLQLFLADVGKHKLLTAAEEVKLAKRKEPPKPVPPTPTVPCRE